MATEPEDEDFALALRLQTELSEKDWSNSATGTGFGYSVDVGSNNGFDSVMNTKQDNRSIIDPEWELVDPNPDIQALFLQFNEKFFYGKLSGIEVKYSPRMTLCAGVCVYEGRGGLCSVRLSAPLLRLRPRRDLVETLLHEMIHALLFVTHNNRDHDAHGPEFLKHMQRINGQTGTNISVYHSFHDEVNNYRQHWWRCDGPCKDRKPYFGYVKRAMNRAPSARDTWWAEHQRTCGGTYTKNKEPEGYGQKRKPKKSTKSDESKSQPFAGDIRQLFPPISNCEASASASRSSSRVHTIDSSPAKDNVQVKFTGGGSNIGGTEIKSLDEVRQARLKRFLEPCTTTTTQPGLAKSNGVSEIPHKRPNFHSVSVSAIKSPGMALSMNNAVDVVDLTDSGTECTCPVCSETVLTSQINTHLDKYCL